VKMKKKKNFRLYITIAVAVLAVIATVTVAVRTVKNSRTSVVSELKQKNKALQTKLTNLELMASQLESQSNQLKTQLKDLITLQEMDLGNRNDIQQSKQTLSQREQEYNKLTEEYAMLSESYNELLQESLKSSDEPEDPRTPRFTPEQMEEFRNTMRDRTYEVLDSRITQAKTEYEVGIFEQMQSVYDNIFDIQEQARNAEGEERERLRQEMGEQWRALGELNQAYNSYQWKTLAEEYGVKNTDEFIKRAQSINQSNTPFGMGGGRTAQ
ncbi:MAG: hypothetical protein KKH49_06745, partial [Candidatus Omnitrophica bacterium]|nr:hypothetical protein [Candidatus Omnitrophota bacterium]